MQNNSLSPRQGFLTLRLLIVVVLVGGLVGMSYLSRKEALSKPSATSTPASVTSLENGVPGIDGRTETMAPEPSAAPDVSTPVEPDYSYTKYTKNGYFIESTDGIISYLFKVQANGDVNQIGTFDGGSITSVSDDGLTAAYNTRDGDVGVLHLDTSKKEVLLTAKNMERGTAKYESDSTYYDAAEISPDGKNLLFTMSGWEIALNGFIRADGTGYALLDGGGSPPSCYKGDIAWKPDSSGFAVTAEINNFGGYNGCVYIADTAAPLAGKNWAPKDSRGFEKGASDPSWSPDGSKLAFSLEYLDHGTTNEQDALANEHRGIYVINADGTNLKQVTANQSYSTSPVWLDSTTLVYALSSYYTKALHGIYTIQLDGSANTKIGSESREGFSVLTMNSDKTKVIYTSQDSIWSQFTAGQVIRTSILDVKTSDKKLLNTKVIK